MHRVLRTTTVVQHVLTGVLAIVCITRGWTLGAPRLPLTLAALAFMTWYAVGLRHRGRLPSDVDQQGFPLPGQAPAAGHGGLARWWFLGLVLLWLAWVIISPDSVWLAFSLWLLAPHFFGTRSAIALCVGILAVVIWRPWLATGSLTVAEALGPAVGALFAFALSRGQHQLVRDAIERQRLVESLVRAQEESSALHEELSATQREAGALQERARLSRDIHDTLAQGFSSIVLLARGRSVVGGEAELSDLLSRVESTAAANLDEARRVVSALAPSALEDSGLVQALGRLLDSLEQDTGIDTDLRIEGHPLNLPTTSEVALLRTVQGALANVRSHAAAQRVVITLSELDHQVLLEVVDDGVGFDPRFVPDRAGGEPWGYSHGGYGLPSTRARLRELGGDLRVESAPGEGTALSAHLPLGGRP